MQRINLVETLEKMMLAACGLVPHFIVEPLTYNNDVYNEQPGNTYVLRVFPNEELKFKIISGTDLSDIVLEEKMKDLRNKILSFLTVALGELIPTTPGLAESLLFAKTIYLRVTKGEYSLPAILEIESKGMQRFHLHPGFYLEKFPIGEWQALMNCLYLFGHFTVSEEGPIYTVEETL